YDAIDDFSKWADKKIGDATGFRGIYVGKGGVHLMSDAEAGAGLSGQITGGQGTVPRLADTVRPMVDEKTVASPTSVTGGLVKNVAQFLTGLALTKRTMGAVGVPTSAPGAAGYALSAAQGAAANFAAFDPHQNRLSNLIEKFPALSNPVTQYLSSQPGDSDAEGRFKNALEGLGLGALTDGFMKGVRLLRGVADAKATPMPATEPGVSENAFRELGDTDPKAPLVADQPFNGPPAPEAPAPGKTPLGNYLRGQDAEMKTADISPQEVLGEPPVPDGHTRLYTGESGAPNDQGRWFSDQKSVADHYEQTYGKGQSFIDVPTEQLGEYRNGPGAYRLPPEVAANRVPLTGPKMPENPKTFINFARIDTPEDVQNVMQTLADKFHGNVESARRGTQSFEQIKLNSQMENAWDLLQNRRVGEPLNAEQSVAARELWASSADKLKNLAQM